MSAPFVVLGTPRSRTAWLAKLLSYRGRICEHEPSRHWRKPDDLFRALDRGSAAIADGTLTYRWREILRHRSDARLLVVWRKPEEVVESFAQNGLRHVGLLPMLRALDDEIEAIMDAKVALVVTAESLSDRTKCGVVFEHCLGKPMPFHRWDHFRDQRIVADAHRHIVDAAWYSAWVRHLPVAA